MTDAELKDNKKVSTGIQWFLFSIFIFVWFFLLLFFGGVISYYERWVIFIWVPLFAMIIRKYILIKSKFFVDGGYVDVIYSSLFCASIFSYCSYILIAKIFFY